MMIDRRHYLGQMLATLALPGVAGQLWSAGPNEIEVKPGANAQDKDDINKPDGKIWVLDFTFKTPRLITVEVPGRGRKVCWYLWYQVSNNTATPRTFIPDFELVTHDKPNKPFRDQILPRVEDSIRKVEDPSNFYKMKNSVSIASDPIPANKKDADPYKTTGVAIWDDVDPDSNNYSIFVSGLSNGWTVDDNGVVRRKTLQLTFRKIGDRFYQDSREIKFVPPALWTYRASDLKVTDKPADKPAEKAP